jgi:hypothetical protein
MAEGDIAEGYCGKNSWNRILLAREVAGKEANANGEFKTGFITGKGIDGAI